MADGDHPPKNAFSNSVLRVARFRTLHNQRGLLRGRSDLQQQGHRTVLWDGMSSGTAIDKNTGE